MLQKKLKYNIIIVLLFTVKTVFCKSVNAVFIVDL